MKSHEISSGVVTLSVNVPTGYKANWMNRYKSTTNSNASTVALTMNCDRHSNNATEHNRMYSNYAINLSCCRMIRRCFTIPTEQE